MLDWKKHDAYEPQGEWKGKDFYRVMGGKWVKQDEVAPVEKEPDAPLFTGKHFKSFWDMSDWTVRIMAYREASNPASNFLYEYTVETLPETLTIPFSLIKNGGGNSNIHYYPLHIVIETPHNLVGVAFSKYALTFPILSESATQYEPSAAITYGGLLESSNHAGKYFYSSQGVGATYNSNNIPNEESTKRYYGENSSVSRENLTFSIANGSFGSSFLVPNPDCLGAQISMSKDDYSTISGSFTLNFANFFVELV